MPSSASHMRRSNRVPRMTSDRSSPFAGASMKLRHSCFAENEPVALPCASADESGLDEMEAVWPFFVEGNRTLDFPQCPRTSQGTRGAILRRAARRWRGAQETGACCPPTCANEVSRTMRVADCVRTPFFALKKVLLPDFSFTRRSAPRSQPASRGCPSPARRVGSSARSTCARSIGTRVARSLALSRHCRAGGARPTHRSRDSKC
jgi:hypothetical protein